LGRTYELHWAETCLIEWLSQALVHIGSGFEIGG
jgi:hypothetical protein